MPISYNAALHKAATDSALSQAIMPLMLCDENLRLCMYTPPVSHIFPGILIGKDMSPMIPPEHLARFRTWEQGFAHFSVSYPNYTNTVIAVVNQYNGAPYYAFLFQPMASLLPEENAYIRSAENHVIDAVDALLHQRMKNPGRLSTFCRHLLHLGSMAHLLDAPGAMGAMPTELIPYVTGLIAKLRPQLSAIGASVALVSDTTQIFRCLCPPNVIGVILSTLIAAAVCLSRDGTVQIACRDGENLTHESHIDIIIPQARYADIASCEELAEKLQILRLDLLAAFDIASSCGIPLSLSYHENGALCIGFALPHAAPGSFTLHSPDYSLDAVFFRAFTQDMADVILLERSLADAGTVE